MKEKMPSSKLDLDETLELLQAALDQEKQEAQHVHQLLDILTASSEQFDQFLQTFQWHGPTSLEELEERDPDSFSPFPDEKNTQTTPEALLLIEKLQHLHPEQIQQDKLNIPLTLPPLPPFKIKKLPPIDKNDERHSCYLLPFCFKKFTQFLLLFLFWLFIHFLVIHW